ncbi:hypothetical protein NP233_g12688 [Leucocoprinus birnbaumii]|uniref:Uncharacterized protein n=1 Tax=Leucocoprinus birnbaumii TaxID=56174 RepID=A0AAD5YMT4_9AGAR|nr:hypothetical protein NP233_g12688 [Leucocoprinus birnbaumii]
MASLQSSQNVTLPEIPELFDPNFLDVLVPKQAQDVVMEDAPAAKTSSNPMINALLQQRPEDNQKYTQNRAQAYASTGSATLDAFNSLSPWSFKEVNQALDKAWAEDPALTLRLIWNMRSIHDGKGELELFYRAFGWLYDHHPRTALTNLHWLVTPVCTSGKDKANVRPHGYWKDLLHILALATCNQLSNLTQRSTFLHNYTPPAAGRRWRNHPYKNKTKEELLELQDQFRARAKDKRRDLHGQFHERVFAKQLRRDLYHLDELRTIDRTTDKERYWKVLRSISLAGKWAPSPAGSHDRVTNISTTICQLLFSPSENVGPMAIGPLPAAAPRPVPGDRENCVILRSFYAHWILKPLRAIISCPEPLMAANRWNEIRYIRVPSKAMASNKKHFIRHDPEGFQEYLIDVQKGKKKLSGATMMPHELVGEAITLSNDLRGVDLKGTKFPKLAEMKKTMAEQQLQVVDAQWRSLVARMKESGNLDNCLAICDVSGSMGTISTYNKRHVQPIFPAIGLSLMLASLAKPPFNSGFVTFSSKPEFHRLPDMDTTSLSALVMDASRAHWEMNTNFKAVFLDLLLPLAIQNHVQPEDMIKRLFVFSDMQFDSADKKASKRKWETNYDLIEKEYRTWGYDVPEIVFWNLMGQQVTFSGATVEVESDRKGVAMMSGFSPAMMKVFMGEAEEEEGEEWSEVTKDGDVVEKKEDEFTPINIMKKALYKKSYDGLVVVD